MALKFHSEAKKKLFIFLIKVKTHEATVSLSLALKVWTAAFNLTNMRKNENAICLLHSIVNIPCSSWMNFNQFVLYVHVGVSIPVFMLKSTSY